MAQITKIQLVSWHEGINTSAEGDQIPIAAYIRGRNSALVHSSAGTAMIAKRKGMSMINPGPPHEIEPGLPAASIPSPVCGLHAFRIVGADPSEAAQHQLLLLDDSGRLFAFTTFGSGTELFNTTVPPASNLLAHVMTPATSELQYLPSFADAKNYCFIVNGVDAIKYDGSLFPSSPPSVTRFGIVAPTTAPTLAAGAAGIPNGTYEGRVTFYNSISGHESSAGPTSATVVVANQQIAWSNIPVSSDSQVDTRRLYIRNVVTQANFYFVQDVLDNSTTTATTNFTDSALTEIGPDENSNDPPPAGVLYLAHHRSRMFAATSHRLYYSALEDPESFDPEAFEEVDDQNSQDIRGIISIFDSLVILKTHSMHVLTGDDPDTWSIRQIDPTIGCLSHRSLVPTPGALFWWSENGPVMWAGGEHPAEIGTPYIAESLGKENIANDSAAVSRIVGAYDSFERRVMFAIPEVGETRNSLMLSFNLRLMRWETNGWDPIEIASMASVYEPSTLIPFVCIGSYSGLIFKWWVTDSDGIDYAQFVAGDYTSSGTFTATATTQTSFTDIAANLPPPHEGNAFATLTGRRITVVDANNVLITSHPRPTITDHTTTSVTLSDALTGLTVGQVYVYYIGGPEFDFQTQWMLHGDGLLKKRYLFVYLQSRPDADVSEMQVDVYTNQDDTGTAVRTVTLDLGVSGAIWDESDWDEADWDGAGIDTQRFRIAHTGISISVRLRHYVPDTPVTIKAISVLAETLSEKLG